MEENGVCFDVGPFFPGSPVALNQANVQQARKLLLEPDWLFIAMFILIMILGVILCIFIWWLSDKYGWFKTSYTETWYHKMNQAMNLLNFQSRMAKTDTEQKVEYKITKLII